MFSCTRTEEEEAELSLFLSLFLPRLPARRVCCMQGWKLTEEGAEERMEELDWRARNRK